MSCEKYIELMSAALDGACTAEERRELDSHLAVCPECAALFNILSANAKAARDLDCEVPADLKSRIMSSLPAQEQPAKQGKVIHWKRWIPVAAAACLILVVSLIPGSMGGLSKDSMNEAAPGAAPAASTSIEKPDYSRDGDAYGIHDTAEEPQVNAEDYTPAEYAGTEYSLSNPQFIRISTRYPSGAQIIGSVESLEEYLSGFLIDYRGLHGVVTADDAKALQEAYKEEFFGNYTKRFFRKHHLLCVIVRSPTCCNRYELENLTRDTVTVRQTEYGFGEATEQYLLIAEVDTVFNDGDTLEVLKVDFPY